MARPLFSSSWYRVADLRPRLRSHTRVHRRRFRGETSYVLEDLSSGQFHRLSPATQVVVSLLDGERTVQEIWNAACETLGDDAPTQDETIRLLGQLHAADALQADLSPDVAELFQRSDQRRRRRLIGRFMNPFAIQIPLFDPERFLARALPFVRPLFGAVGALIWLAVVGCGVVLAAMHWADLSTDITDRLLSAENLFVVWLVFPLLKSLHELGHAFAVKAYGGEVHDMGLLLLVLTPVPYVDASASTAFRRKRERIVVGAAGMIVEVFLASLAMMVWVAVEPGLVRTLAYNVILIGGITTVVFNANPLLRYDGYYMLSDLIEIPNLRQRSSRFMGWLSQRYLLGYRDADSPEGSSSERTWFVGYAIGSFCYRLMVTFAIALLVLDRFFYLGLLLACFGVVRWGLVPLAKGISYLARDPRLQDVRTRAVLGTAAGLGVLGLLLMVPVPFRTEAEGVVWIPDEAIVRADTEGFVERVVAEAGATVRGGDLLFVLRDLTLETEVRRLEARERETRARWSRERARDRVATALIEEDLQHVQRSLARSRERASDLEVRSRVDGTFVSPRVRDLPGRFVQKGQTLGYVVALPTTRLRVVVPQADAALVRERTRGARVRLAERLDEVISATIVRLIPAASSELPSSALGLHGGGSVLTDPNDPRGRRPMRPVFEVELALPDGTLTAGVGGRIHVRFDHGWEPLAFQSWRRIRQLFLATLDV